MMCVCVSVCVCVRVCVDPVHAGRSAHLNVDAVGPQRAVEHAGPCALRCAGHGQRLGETLIAALT